MQRERPITIEELRCILSLMKEWNIDEGFLTSGDSGKINFVVKRPVEGGSPITRKDIDWLISCRLELQQINEEGLAKN